MNLPVLEQHVEGDQVEFIIVNQKSRRFAIALLLLTHGVDQCVIKCQPVLRCDSIRIVTQVGRDEIVFFIERNLSLFLTLGLYLIFSLTLDFVGKLDFIQLARLMHFLFLLLNLLLRFIELLLSQSGHRGETLILITSRLAFTLTTCVH